MIIKAEFQNIIDLVSNVMEAHTAAIFMSVKNGQALKLYCWQTFSKKIKENFEIQGGKGIISWVFREQKDVVAANFERNSKTLELYEEDVDIKSLMAVFLPERKGVLFVDSKRSYAFTEEKEKILKQMASLLFTAICENEKKEEIWLISRALEANLKADEKVKNIYELKGLLKKISMFLDLKHLILFRLESSFHICQSDENNKNYFLREIENNKYSPEGLVGWCLKNKKNVLNNRETDGDKTFVVHKEDGIKTDNILAIPLQYNKNCEEKNIRGVVIFSKRKENKEKLIKNNTFWHAREAEILENVGVKLLKICDYLAL